VETRQQTAAPQPLLNQIGDSPFLDELMNEEIRNNVKPPVAIVYNGEGDPQEHADYYKSLMCYWATEAMKSRLFPGTLIKKANKWFNKLSPHSIHNFRQLRELFVTHLSFRIPRKMTQEDLGNIKQGSNEFLRDYLSIMVDDLSLEVMKNQLISRLQVSEFY
jgi:hypothetical protein